MQNFFRKKCIFTLKKAISQYEMTFFDVIFLPVIINNAYGNLADFT